MKTIYKYPFSVSDHVVIKMPIGAKILDVKSQSGKPCLWALIDTDNVVTSYHFQMRGTGHDCKGINPENHVATFQMMGGALVFHLFQE